jgi:hypothetical protein
MTNRIWKSMAVLGASAGIAFGAVTLAQASNGAVHKTAVRNGPAQLHHGPGRLHHGTSRPHPVRRAQTGTDPTGVGPTTEPTETTTEQESTAEPEAGQPGEPVNGHEDAGANVNHECTADCVE